MWVFLVGTPRDAEGCISGIIVKDCTVLQWLNYELGNWTSRIPTMLSSLCELGQVSIPLSVSVFCYFLMGFC